MPRPAPSAASLSYRFSRLVEGLRGAVAARSAAERALAPLLVLLWNRLGRMARRFASAAGRSGARPSVRRAVRALRDGDRVSPSRAPLPPGERMPREFGWLLRLAPEAACYGGQLQQLLAEEGMAELLAQAPGARRVLRSMCRMLAIAPGPQLALRAAAQRKSRAPAVIPAKAGIQGREHRRRCVALDPGLRRDDGLGCIAEDSGPRWRFTDGVG